eukprot:m.69397 g.69397  ORF g.69397 m.69397 type:complete len:195 (-) comp14123_c0_seq1:53-637(-)
MASSNWNVAALSDLLTLETDYESIQREQAGLPALSLAQEAELMSKVLAQRFLTTYSNDEVQSAFTVNIEGVVQQNPAVLHPAETTLSALMNMPEVLSFRGSSSSLTPPLTPPALKPLLSVSICSARVDEFSDAEIQSLLQPIYVDEPMVADTDRRNKPERCDSGFQDIEDILLAAISSVTSKAEPSPRSLESYV